MTPIYRSPNHKQTRAIQSLLLDHSIQASIIENKKSDQQLNSRAVVWYELWLRNYADAARAKAIITQHEFTSFKTSMSAFKTTVSQPVASTSQQPAPTAVDELPITEEFVSETKVIMEEPPVSVASPAPASAQTRDDNLIPINNKRVFKRLGLLLGYSEEEIEKLDSNKLYRPWDGGTLMERVKNLKQKCS
ncbi:hypothetical protein [Kaarinaea lacus]